MSSRRLLINRLGLIVGASIWATGCPAAQAAEEPPRMTTGMTAGELRFFSGCPSRPLRRLHDETNPWDPHALLYTALGASQLDVVRVVDAAFDAPLPGRPVRPLRRTIEALRAAYGRLPPWRIVQRVGEFIDALQIPELSLGDANATYSFMTGGTGGPGSGMALRVSKLLDWTQHVTGDLNRLIGRVAGRPQGLVAWSLPERVIDGSQWLLLRSVNRISLVVTRTADRTLTAAEWATDQALNAGRRRPHMRETVFLAVPLDVYQAHEAWIDEYRSRLVVATREELASTTHAALMHQPRPKTHSGHTIAGAPIAEVAPVVLMIGKGAWAHAPRSLQPYVVPAAWVLNPKAGEGR